MLLGNRVAESLCRIRQPYHVYLSIDGGNEQARDSNRGKDSFRRAVRGGHCLLRHRGESAWPHVSLYQLDLGVDEATYDARSEERRVGKECVSTGRSRWSPYTEKQKK